MRVSDIPYNMKTSFNFSFHEEPMDMDEMRKGVDYLLSEVENEQDTSKKAILQKYLGHYLRVLNDHENALGYLKDSYKYYQSIDDKIMSIDLMYRIGVTYYYKESYAKAEDMLQLAKYLISKHPSEHHDIFEHNLYFYLGLTLKAQGRKSGAATYFTESLERRVVKGDLDLIKMCQEALVSVS